MENNKRIVLNLSRIDAIDLVKVLQYCQGQPYIEELCGRLVSRITKTLDKTHIMEEIK